MVNNAISVRIAAVLLFFSEDMLAWKEAASSTCMPTCQFKLKINAVFQKNKTCGKEKIQRNELMILGGKYVYFGPFTAGNFENVDVARKMHVTAPTTVRGSSNVAHSS